MPGLRRPQQRDQQQADGSLLGLVRLRLLGGFINCTFHVSFLILCLRSCRCVFDVMTTGEVAAADFMAAAHSAQADVLRFDPESLRNRTTTKLRPRDVTTLPTSGARSYQCCSLRILFVITVIMIIVK